VASVRLLPGAVEDLFRLDEFLRSRNPGAADKVSRLLEAALGKLARFPKLGKLLDDHPPYRELPVAFGARGFVVRYRLLASEVVVVRVWHMREGRR
jgi:toxin ParE1/3/4